MSNERVVVVTGVAGYWGARVAAQLVAGPGLRVIGLDAEQPGERIPGLDFVQADIRNPLMEEFLRAEGAHTLVHLAFEETLRPSEPAFDLNVMGTMKLLGGAAKAGVRKIVVNSSTAVYGAQPDNSLFLAEDQPLRGSRRYGYTRDLVEIEAFCNGFRGQLPEMMLTVLRFASIVGPKADTPMTRFLKDLGAPVLLGFDPLMQVIHEDDVVGALCYSVAEDRPGVFNVAAEMALPLWRVMGLAGKIPLPVLHPVAYLAAMLGPGRYAPIEPDYLRYPWVGDLTRMREEFGFAPQYTAEEALREFAGRQRVRQYVPEAAALSYDEERLRDTIERRNRAREQRIAAPEQKR